MIHHCCHSVETLWEGTVANGPAFCFIVLFSLLDHIPKASWFDITPSSFLYVANPLCSVFVIVSYKMFLLQISAASLLLKHYSLQHQITHIGFKRCFHPISHNPHSVEASKAGLSVVASFICMFSLNCSTLIKARSLSSIQPLRQMALCRAADCVCALQLLLTGRFWTDWTSCSCNAGYPLLLTDPRPLIHHRAVPHISDAMESGGGM